MPLRDLFSGGLWGLERVQISGIEVALVAMGIVKLALHFEPQFCIMVHVLVFILFIVTENSILRINSFK